MELFYTALCAAMEFIKKNALLLLQAGKDYKKEQASTTKALACYHLQMGMIITYGLINIAYITLPISV